MKKIDVCHGKTCMRHGAETLLKKLREHFSASGVSVGPRECCGNCANNNSIVVDGEVTIGNLTSETVDDFIRDPESALQSAREAKNSMRKTIDDLLKEDLLL